MGEFVALVLAMGITYCAPGAVAEERSALGPEAEALKIVGMTLPSKAATLASVQPARITLLPATEGSVVREGELLVGLDDRVQAAKTEIARAAAESNLEIELTRVRMAHAAREWNRLVKLHGGEHATSKELSDFQALMETTRLEYELAMLKHEQAGRTYLREKRILDEFQIRAPFAGYVSERLKQVGETVDELEGVLALVALDPLVVVVDCPVALASSITEGDRFQVAPVDTRWTPRVGIVVFASRAADRASQTFRVKLEVPNKDQSWLSGLKVVVDFSREIELNAHAASGGTGPVAVSRGAVEGAKSEGGTIP